MILAFVHKEEDFKVFKHIHKSFIVGFHSSQAYSQGVSFILDGLPMEVFIAYGVKDGGFLNRKNGFIVLTCFSKKVIS
jgi:hypothetical protein